MILLKISTKLFFNIQFSTISYQTLDDKTFFKFSILSKMATKTLVLCTMILVSIFSVLIIGLHICVPTPGVRTVGNHVTKHMEPFHEDIWVELDNRANEVGNLPCNIATMLRHGTTFRALKNAHTLLTQRRLVCKFIEQKLSEQPTQFHKLTKLATEPSKKSLNETKTANSDKCQNDRQTPNAKPNTKSATKI